jgi:hypothetical protein
MSKEQYDARVVVDVRQFSPAEDMLLAEASDLGLAVGAVPHYVEVRSADGTKEAQFALDKVTEVGWELKLTAYAEPTTPENRESGVPQWTPKRMVILND